MSYIQGIRTILRKHLISNAFFFCYIVCSNNIVVYSAPMQLLKILNSFNFHAYLVYNNVRIFLPFVEFHDLCFEALIESVYVPLCCFTACRKTQLNTNKET